jgi:transposase
MGFRTPADNPKPSGGYRKMTKTTTDPAPARFVGCDVGKRHIVVFDSASGKTQQIENKRRAIAALARSLDKDCLALCEATGGHEAALLEALAEAGIPAHRADARKVKAFIRSWGTLGKSDSIDARALARYGAERHEHLRLWSVPDRQRARLQALVRTRRDLVDERTAHNNRLGAPGGKIAAPYLKKLIACLERQIQRIEADIQALLDDCEELDRCHRALTDIKGIGQTTAATLIALMPELGTLTRREAAALAGLAPHPNQSGLTDGYRRTRGGRKEVKQALFMAALSASRHHPTLAPFRKRLIKDGKKPIVAATAVMRRLVVIANAKIRDEFNQNIKLAA